MWGGERERERDKEFLLLFSYLFSVPSSFILIIGGKESVPHSRPFMAKIKGSSICGGTLIKSNWVLTAGDSGGPLICKGEQRGIVSCGIKCGMPQYPGIYTLLTNKYSHWIKSVIQGSL
uniref:Peptidase S1 domain-containing protein n=1 Tax=Pseudonaja textilis TaxID=8673 RepID=A0A670YUG7_PSETE